MSDLISKVKIKYEIDDLLERNNKLIDEWLANCIDDIIVEQPTIEPTLYGYKLYHLAFVAKLLQNKGVTEENLADVLNSADWIVGLVLEEQRKTMDEALKKVEVENDSM